MNGRMIIYVLGRFMLVGALLLALPMLIALIYGEKNMLGAFIITIVGLLLPGIVIGLFKPANSDIYAREGFIIVALCWIILALYGALPFYLSGYNLSYLDCVFETVSGLTTTGSSILANVEILPRSLLFWRSFTIWIGGMGVLVFMLAILSSSESNYINIAKAEVPGPQFGKLVSRLKFNMRILYSIYAVLTLMLMLFFMLGGMPVFDSIVNAFSTAGTGGFTITNSSIAAYNSAYIEYVTAIFMLLFGINFALYYLIITGHVIQALKSEELKWFLAIIICSVIIVTVNITPLYGKISNGFRYAFFQVTSIISTTGFSTADFNTWPLFSKAILIILMFFGGCAGSTAGGLKISRVIILIKSAIREIRRAISPRSVRAVKFEKQALNNDVIYGINAYFTILIFFTFVSFLILSLDKLDMTSAFSAVTACINNVGPGFGIVGPMGNYSTLSGLSKFVLIFDMLAGRLEFYPVLMLFSPTVWKRS